jgi:hypothetical protein
MAPIHTNCAHRGPYGTDPVTEVTIETRTPVATRPGESQLGDAEQLGVDGRQESPPRIQGSAGSGHGGMLIGL